MPEINPLTNDQIFLKKIAENTGSNYETGDVSEINPLSINQIFLKEIAANTAGQAGDITELEGKVADNTAAIGAMVNVTGAKNVLKYPYTDSTNTQGGLTFTDNGDGTVDVSGSETTGANVYFALENDISVTLGTKVSDIFPTAGKYTISCKNADGTNIYMSVYIADVGSFDHISEDGTDVEITNAMMSKTLRIHLEVKHDYVLSSAVTLKPMIRPAGTDSTYVPYAMTNRELTDRTERSVEYSGALDNLVKPGFYITASGVTNTPNDSDYHFINSGLFVSGNGISYCSQMIIDTRNQLFSRTCNNGTWSSWEAYTKA